MSKFNSAFWASHFEKVFKKQIIAFREAVISRFLPTFEKIEDEAEAVSIKEWENPTINIDPEYFDEADLAARAENAGVDHYLTQLSIKQTLLNLTISALYHIFEQQLLLFHRREVLRLDQEHEIKLMTISELKKILSQNEIQIEQFSIWPKIEELRNAANAIKHAEGQSANKLRVLRPDVFTHPSTLTLSLPIVPIGNYSIYMPLAGEDLFFKIEDIENYCDYIITFWDELSEALSAINKST